MGYRFFQDQKLNISFRSNFRQAVFGLFHVAFLDNNDQLILPLEDKESLSSALDFYQSRILLSPTFPVFDGKGYYPKDSHDPEVLSQILGLPKQLYSRLDLHEPILPQLKFRPGLQDLKKEVYISIYRPTNRKWFSDDFHSYCLTKGIFFPYEETQPFVEQSVSMLPVYLDETKLPSHVQELCQQSDSERFIIDLARNVISAEEREAMQKLDAFSLERRLYYFINDEFDQNIADLSLTLDCRRHYCSFLKQYLVSLINVLYDDYCFEVLHHVTTKLSYLSISKLQTERDVYSLSSYQADMYSFDKKHFFFAASDRKFIQANVMELIKRGVSDTLELYQLCGLPYLGYRYVKELKKPSAEAFVRALPFEDGITKSELYLSAKRYSRFYSYLSDAKEHKASFLYRLLGNQGVHIYTEKSLLDLDAETKVQITIYPTKRLTPLDALFDGKEFSLSQNVMPAYLLSHRQYENQVLEQMVKDIDDLSQQKAGTMFFCGLSFTTIRQSVDNLLYEISYQPKDVRKLIDFFLFLFYYPFRIMESRYRNHALKEGDTYSLLALDGMPNQAETFEPNLPYPYVSQGMLCYSFRKTYFSQPYLCSSEKDAITARFFYLRQTFEKRNPKAILFEKNRYILENLGLPGNISSGIDLSKDILLQIPYQDHICHRCLLAQPTHHESIDDNEAESYNVYLTYLYANAGRHGVFFQEPFSEHLKISHFMDLIKEESYHGLLSFDREKVDPILYPYLDVTPKTIVSMLACFFPSDMGYDDFLNDVLRFADLGTETIRKILFDCTKDLYPYILEFFNVFSRLCYLYKMVELSYAFYVSEDIVSEGECEFCLNIDHSPRLPYPYVILGAVYNAYSDDLKKGDFYFCSCEKESMKGFVDRYLQAYLEQPINREYATAVVLGLSGFPFLVTASLAEFDLALEGSEGLFQKLKFRDAICRRCTSISHSAYDEPFRKAFPFKDSMNAEYDFAVNRMVHDGLRLLTDVPVSAIRYSPSYRYLLSGYADPLLPVLSYSGKDTPLSVYTALVPDPEKVGALLYEYATRNPGNAEAVAYASGVILDTYHSDKEVFLDFIEAMPSGQTWKESVIKYFPEVSRVRDAFLNVTIEAILGFITFMMEKIIYGYALEDSHIGR